MQQGPQNCKTQRATAQLLWGVGMLLCGCSIYLLFRSKTINLYQWSSMIGCSDVIDAVRMSIADWKIPDFIRFSLPDGLYCASYILLMDAVWPDNAKYRGLAISLIPLIAIAHELAQFFGFAKGTFDICDLLCYAAPLVVYYFSKKYHFIINNLNFNFL